MPMLTWRGGWCRVSWWSWRLVECACAKLEFPQQLNYETFKLVFEADTMDRTRSRMADSLQQLKISEDIGATQLHGSVGIWLFVREGGIHIRCTTMLHINCCWDPNQDRVFWLVYLSCSDAENYLCQRRCNPNDNMSMRTWLKHVCKFDRWPVEKAIQCTKQWYATRL